MLRTKTILYTAVSLLIGTNLFGNPDHRQEASGPISIIFLPDIQYNDPFSDAEGINLKMDHLLNTVAASNPMYVIFGNHTSNQVGSNPVKETVIYQTDIYYPNWIKQVSKFHFTWYTVFNDNNLGGKKWHDHKSVIFDVYQDQYQKYFKMPRTGGEDGAEGLQYWVAKEDVLLIVLNAYNQPDIKNGEIVPNLGDAQLTWLSNTLKYHQFYPHKIVVSSSADLINNEKDLLPILEKYEVDCFVSFDGVNLDTGDIDAMAGGLKIINLNTPDGFPRVLSYYLLSIDTNTDEFSFEKNYIEKN